MILINPKIISNTFLITSPTNGPKKDHKMGLLPLPKPNTGGVWTMEWVCEVANSLGLVKSRKWKMNKQGILILLHAFNIFTKMKIWSRRRIRPCRVSSPATETRTSVMLSASTLLHCRDYVFHKPIPDAGLQRYQKNRIKREVERSLTDSDMDALRFMLPRLRSLAPAAPISCSSKISPKRDEESTEMY